MTENMTGGMVIAIHEARDACKGEPDIMERLRKAMAATHGHWMETNENNQFRSALAAAMVESDEPEKDRIARSAKALNKVGAMIQALQAGVPVDMETMVSESTDDDIIGLMGLWREVKGGK